MSKQQLKYEVEQLKRVVNPDKTCYVLVYREPNREDYDNMIRHNKFMLDPKHPFSTYKKYLAYHSGRNRVLGVIET